jgi:hypothetical protein
LPLAVIAIAGDMLILVAFPFLGSLEHDVTVNAPMFTRTFVPFAIAWLALVAASKAYGPAGIRSLRRTLLTIPPAWLIAGVAAIAIRVWVFDRPFVLSFAIVGFSINGA